MARLFQDTYSKKSKTLPIQDTSNPRHFQSKTLPIQDG